MTPGLRLTLAVSTVMAAFVIAAWARRHRRPGWAFLASRLAWLAVIVFLVFTASFFLMRAVPGGPFDRERDLTPEVRRVLEARYRLDRPLAEQYVTVLNDLLQGDLGPSLTLPDRTVAEVIADGLPASLALGLTAAVWALLLGLPAGALAATHRGRPLDRWVTGAATLGLALPGFVLAAFLLIPLAFQLAWLPPAGFQEARSVILPSFCLGAPYGAQIARLFRTSLLEILGSEWIRTARAKGLSAGQVLIHHAARGAMVPVVTFLGPALAGILTGSLVIEQIFAIPGIGTHFVQGALARDYPLAMGMILLFTAVLTVANIGVDLLASVLDPRVELS